MAVELVVFDLDGTLVDSKADICASIAKALEYGGVPPVPVEQLAPMIGIPLKEIFNRLLPASTDAKLDDVCAFYRRWYFDHCAVETTLFHGVRECLDRLVGVKRAIGTGKMRFQAIQVLEQLGLSSDFDLVVGSDGLPYKPDPATLNTILQQLNVAPHRAWMVGDTTIDMLAGKAAGMRTCAVTYGTDSRQALEDTAPDMILDNLADFPARIGVVSSSHPGIVK